MFRRTMAIVAGAALVLAGALAVQPAAATDIGPQGGPTAECKAAGYDYGVKLDEGGPGEYEYDDDGDWTPLSLPISLKVWIANDNTFTWEAAPAVAAVLVKAGTGYTILPGGTSGGGTPSSGKGISHITFCYDDEPQYEPEEHLTVSKTVETSYDRKHNWTMQKNVDTHDVYLYAPGGAGSGTATVDWDVDVEYIAPPTDSGFKVWGTITVLNDGDTAVAVYEVTDTITVDLVDTDVAVDCGVDFAVAAVPLAVGESLECTYEYEPSSKIDGVNTATASTLTGFTYESLPMPINWGDPATETDETVTLTDVSTVDGEQSKTFTAPDGGTLEYSHTFNWTDYEKCGVYTAENVATLTSYDSYLELVDSETVTVHVQCLTFDDETAWAANAGPLTDRYVKKGNWATYVTYTGGTKTYNLYAGQTMLAGTVTIAPAGAGFVTVKVDLAGAWDYAENGANLKVQGYTSKPPASNPEPGLFASHTVCTGDPCTTQPIAYNGGTMYYGIHVDVGRWVPDPLFGP